MCLPTVYITSQLSSRLSVVKFWSEVTSGFCAGQQSVLGRTWVSAGLRVAAGLWPEEDALLFVRSLITKSDKGNATDSLFFR